MNLLHYINAPLLWGMSAAAVPLVIHLLYRRRFRRVDWAPMRYLKLSIKRNRKRIRIEQLLLLLLRMALVMLLFYTVARPVMHAEAVSAWLGGGSRSNQVIIIDDSLSMDYRHRGRSALEQARQIALEVAGTFRPDDRVSLLVTSRPAAPLLREVEATQEEEIIQAIEAISPTATLSGWSPTLLAARDLIESSTYKNTTEITVITDLRRAGWDEQVGEAVDSLAALGVRLRIFDVGAESTENVAVVELRRRDRVALVGTPTRWEATVRNDSGGALAEGQATLLIDGRPSTVRLPALAAGATAQVPLSATFQKPGPHWISFQLTGDALPGDDRYWDVVEVREKLDILLVNGEPAGEVGDGETFFLLNALAIGEGAAGAWQIEEVTAAEWVEGPLGEVDLLILANVPNISQHRAQQLERLVRGGMGVMIFPGDLVDRDQYNQWLFRGGKGMLPARLIEDVDQPTKGIVLADLPDSPLEMLRPLTTSLQRLGARRLMHVVVPDETAGDDVVRVLARWNNAGLWPAAVEKQCGAGRVLLWTTSADRAWSDWAISPLYVMAVRESAKALARGDRHVRRGVAGEPIRWPLAGSGEVSAATVTLPAADSSQPLRIEFAGESSGNSTGARRPVALVCDDTQQAGLYALAWQQAQRGGQQSRVAVNPHPRESRLERIDEETVRRLLGAVDVEIISAAGEADVASSVRGEELWRRLAAGLFVLLMFEAALAAWTGRLR